MEKAGGWQNGAGLAGPRRGPSGCSDARAAARSSGATPRGRPPTPGTPPAAPAAPPPRRAGPAGRCAAAWRWGGEGADGREPSRRKSFDGSVESCREACEHSVAQNQTSVLRPPKKLGGVGVGGQRGTHIARHFVCHKNKPNLLRTPQKGDAQDIKASCGAGWRGTGAILAGGDVHDGARHLHRLARPRHNLAADEQLVAVHKRPWGRGPPPPGGRSRREIGLREVWATAQQTKKSVVGLCPGHNRSSDPNRNGFAQSHGSIIN